MAVKAFSHEAVEVSPVMWKQRRAADFKAPVPRHNPAAAPPPEEVQTLRARIAELTASSEQSARQAYEAGRQAGESAARQAMQAEVRAATERLAQTITDLAATRSEAFRAAEADAVRLALEIARRVLHRELSVDSSAVQALVKAALEKLHAQEIHRVKVHPNQEKLLRACLEQAGRNQSIEIVADPSQQMGGALFELSHGALDASVDTQLREIERGLADELRMRR
jgi:flagellar assembly protein FliH